MNHFEKFSKANVRIFLGKNARFFEKYGFILALKLRDN